MIDLSDLRLVETAKLVARSGVRHAAEQLGLSQSTISERLRSLELGLGVDLFVRQGRRIEPTAAGHRLLAYADRLLDLAHEATMAVRQDTRPDRFRIGAVESLLAYRLAPVIEELRRRRPTMLLEIVASQSPNLVENLHDGRIDVAFVVMPRLHRPGCLVKSIEPAEIVLLAAPTHPLAASRLVRMSDLDGQYLFLPEPGCSYRMAIEADLRRARVEPRHVTSFSSVEAIKRNVEAGIGIALLPRYAAISEIASGALTVLPLRAARQELWTQLVTLQLQAKRPAIRDLISLLAAGIPH
jgi:DNA-binding transcriptional LysR family regulator